MKKLTQNILTAFVLILLFFSYACQDVWEEHYDGALKDLPDYNLFEYIGSNSNLGIFTQMLQKSGYDTIISASQTYTIWAPVDAALSGIDLNNEEQISEIVENHIARGNISTSTIQARSVKMLNGKNISFERGSSGFTFGKKSISEPNLMTHNGQVHIIDDYVPYTTNILEFIERTDGLDSLDSYFKRQNRYVFDPYSSLEIGYDSAGNVVYDSIFNLVNMALYQLGELGTEDSLYTALLPDNMAWTEAYQRTEPYYNIPEIFGGAERKRMATEWAIVKDLVFRDLVYDPTEFEYLQSTTGNTFYSPVDLFANAQQHELSNGIGYTTDQMPYADTASWFKPIKIEAEVERNRDNANSDIYIRTGYGSGLDISGDEYIVVDPTGISNLAQPNVKFSIPDVLSAAYDMYCVFVPAYITDPQDTLSNKVKFQLVYISTTTGRTRRRNITPEHNETDPSGLTKMFIERFDFEFATVTDYDFNEIPVKLQVTNTVTIEEENAGLFSRTMRIDKIIFEPVFE